jgi:uncharacterized HAD superfamily protein
MAEGTGLRYDQGKLRYDLVNADAHKGMVEILTFGAQKYAERNWERGMKWSKVISSLKRHLAAIEAGEDFDVESGKLHADHIACNAHFLSAYYRIFPQGDDRPHKYLKHLKVGLDIDGVLADFTGHLMKVSGNEGHIAEHWNDPIVRREFDKIKKDENFWATIPPLLTRQDIPFEPHCYITARSIDPAVTQEWLNKNLFPTAPLYCVGVGESKIEIAKKSGIDVMVDDSITNFAELNSNGVFCYLYDAPYNRKYNVGYKRIKSLKEIAH